MFNHPRRKQKGIATDDLAAKTSKKHYYVPLSKDKCLDLTYDTISECKDLAFDINHADEIDVFYTKLCALLEKLDLLIFLNEKKHISMTPTPRANMNEILANKTNTINDFLDRAAQQAYFSTVGASRPAAIRQFISAVKEHSGFCHEMNTENWAHLKSLFSEAVEAQKQADISHIGIYQELDLTPYDDLEIIRAFEAKLKRLYDHCVSSAASVEECLSLFDVFEVKCETYKLALVVQIRLEQLIDEYRKKLNNSDFIALLDGLEGHQFEHWCAALLEKNGFSNIKVTPGSNDHGVDIVAVKDDIHYAFQCKCYSSDLGNSPVQEVSAGRMMYQCQVGVVMTNRHFTKGAKELAAATGTLLWDRDKLLSMMRTD